MPNALTITLAGVDITTNVDMTTVVMQLAGSQETATCEFDIIDTANSISATDEATLTVTEVSSATVLFGGFVRSRRITIIATGRIIHILATDYNSLLDRAIVVSDKRVAGESDKARLTYLMTTYGPQFSSDYTKITTLNASMVAQKFVALTLRQAIERVLGQASTKSSYFVDPTGRLNTYDRTIVTAAPFNVRVGTPLGGELAPEEFSVDNDASNLANAIYIVGATAAGSGWFTDVTSISTYGRRERFFNAPDADTAAKASQLGLAVLADQKNPVPRGLFTTKSPNDGWRIGQSITVTSTQHGLAAVSYRIARVTVHYLSGVGDREYSIEIGAPQVSMPALLAAAHGGGGGYPWTSPGGSGSWTPIISSGQPGGGVSGSGGCACNTPYTSTVFDTFTRSVSGAWGTSDEGTAWVGGGGDPGMSVAGGKGILSVGPSFVSFDENNTAVINSITQSFRVVHMIFQASSFAPGSAGQNMLITLKDTSGSPTPAAQIWVPPSGVTTLAILLNGSSVASSSISLAAGVDLTLMLQTDYGTGTYKAKLFHTASGDPGTWNVTYVDAPQTATPPILDVRADWTGAGDRTVSVNEIDFDFGPPNSGTPYPWTDLGVGNNVQTAFTFPVPFRPGTLETRVDTATVTPLSQDATTGIFTLPFPPSGIEHVWAKAITA